MAQDVTDSIELLGNPSEGSNLSGMNQSVWDLQEFDGRIYLGGGNTTNNKGRVDIWSYDPGSVTFSEEQSNINTEAIEIFRVIDDRLYVPGADPVDGNALKYYYLDQGGQWTGVSDNLNMAHIRDITKAGPDHIIGVGNSRNTKGDTGIVRSTPNGADFERASDNAPYPGYWPATAFYSAINYDGKIIATSYSFNFSPSLNYVPLADGTYTQEYLSGIGVYEPTANRATFSKVKFDLSAGFVFPESNDHLNLTDFLPVIIPAYLPEVPGGYCLRFSSNVELGETLLYTLRCYSVNTTMPDNYYQNMYMRTGGLYVKTKLQGRPTSVIFPSDPAAIGEDVLIVDGKFEALAVKKVSNTEYINSVWTSPTPQVLTSWVKKFEFTTASRAKSFEYLNGAYYFGVGAHRTENASEAGNILRHQFAAPPAADYETLSSYVDWGAIPVDQRAADDDPDGDGQKNLWEIALGSDPTSASVSTYPAANYVDHADGSRITTLSYPKVSTGIVYASEVSSDLSDWSTTGFSTETFNSESGLYEVSHTAQPDLKRLFFRLKVSQSEN